MACESFPSIGSIFKGYHDADLQNKLVQAVKGHGFNMSVAVGEGAKTVSMAVGAIKSVATALKHARHGDFTATLRALKVEPHTSPRSAFTSKDLAGRWLEVQYGWKPLLSDVNEAAKAYALLANKPRVTRLVVNKVLRSTWNSSESPSNWSCLGPLTVGKKISYEMTEYLSTPRSLGLYDPLSLVWELTPYSFVFDWFIPIGTYLENLNSIPSLRGRFVTSTFESFSGFSSIGGPPYYTGCITKVQHLELVRTFTTGLSTALPSFKPLDKALSAGHVWNALALARNMLQLVR